MNRIVINGQVISGDLIGGKGLTVTSNGDKILINGEEVLHTSDKWINIHIEGDVDGDVNTVSGNVIVNGDVGNVKSTSGDVGVSGAVCGDVKTVSGDVEAGQILGNTKTVSGDIRTK